MPRLKEAMKDVAWLRYASGRCLATFDPKISEWGNLSREEREIVLRTKISKYRYIEISARSAMHTRGSETSQYPEEEKTMLFPK